MLVCVMLTVVSDCRGRIIKTDRHTARRGQCDGQNPPSLSVSHEECEGEQSCEGSQVSLSPSALTR